MENNKLQRFAVFGLLYVNLGRPQDVLPLIKSIHPGMVFGVLVLYSLYQSRNENRIFSDEVFHEKKWFLALWVMMIIATFFSIYTKASVEFLIEYSKVVLMLFGLLSVLKDERDFSRLATVFLASVLTLCLPIVLGGSTSDRVSVGTFYDPNDMAMFVSCSIPFLLYLFHKNSIKLKILSFGAIVLGVVTVIATQSRMGFLALILNGLFYLIGNLSTRRNTSRKLIVMGAVIVVFMTFAGNYYWDRIETTFEQGQTGSGRTLVWKRGLQVVAEYPVTGAGPGTFISAYGRMLKAGQFESVGNVYDRAWKAAHNTYLVVAAELGIAGFVFFMMIIRTSLGRLSKIRKLCIGQKNNTHIQALTHVTVSSFSIFLFCALFLSHAYSPILMTLVACSILVQRIYDREERLSHDPLKTQT